MHLFNRTLSCKSNDHLILELRSLNGTSCVGLRSCSPFRNWSNHTSTAQKLYHKCSATGKLKIGVRE